MILGNAVIRSRKQNIRLEQTFFIQGLLVVKEKLLRLHVPMAGQEHFAGRADFG